MPDEFITPATLATDSVPPKLKAKRPRRRAPAKRKPAKKSSEHSFRTFLLSVIGAGVVMLVVGYTIGISLGVNLGVGFGIRDSGLGSQKSVAVEASPEEQKAAELPISDVRSSEIPPSDEQVACLKKALGPERYVEIASNISQPTLDEQAQMAVCVK